MKKITINNAIFTLRIANPPRDMLLGPPGCTQALPCSSPGPLDFWWYAKKRINHSRVATNTRPTECPTQPRRMTDASRVYTFILTTKCIQNWASFRAISCAKNRTRADSNFPNTSDSNSIRSSARTGDTCSLLKHDAENK